MNAAHAKDAKSRFGEILLRAGLLDAETLQHALSAAHDSTLDVGHFMIEYGRFKPVEMVKAVSRALGVTRVGLEHAQPDPRALDRVGLELCLQHWVLPIELEVGPEGDVLHLAMANPTDVTAIQAVAIKAACPLRILVAAGPELRKAIGRFFPGALKAQVSYVGQAQADPEDLFEMSEPTPVIRSKPDGRNDDFAHAETAAMSLGEALDQARLTTRPQTPISMMDDSGMTHHRRHRAALQKIQAVLGPPENRQARCLMYLVAQLAEKGFVDLEDLLDELKG